MGSGRRSSRPVPAIGLLLLAPWVGEFLMGSSPIQHLAAALVLLLPLYGGGALLVREIARRTGRGYPAIVLLGAAYGVIEAGLLDQSMFNPAFRDEGSEADFATLANHALGYVAGHAVWSIAVPIAMIELMAPEGSAAPWLGRKGLTAAAVLYAAGCAIVFSFIYAEYEFLASPVQLAGAAVAAVLLAAAAFAVDRGRAGGFSIGSLSNGGISKDGVSGASGASNPGALPNGRSDAGGGVRPLPVGIGAFAASSAFVARPENGWAGLAAGLLLLGAAWVVVRRWSRSPWWTVRPGWRSCPARCSPTRGSDLSSRICCGPKTESRGSATRCLRWSRSRWWPSWPGGLSRRTNAGTERRFRRMAESRLTTDVNGTLYRCGRPDAANGPIDGMPYR